MKPAIPDIITVIGPAYQQPITDLIDRLLHRTFGQSGSEEAGHRENGYCASIVILLVAMLESYVTRLKFTRKAEIKRAVGIPDLLATLFPGLETVDELREVFLLRNLIAHNHLWHLDVSNPESHGALTIASPIDLGFDVNKNYSDIVDASARRTRRLQLHASPTDVDRSDVKTVFCSVWRTLESMNRANSSDTPLAGRQVVFAGRRIDFEQLIQLL